MRNGTKLQKKSFWFCGIEKYLKNFILDYAILYMGIRVNAWRIGYNV
jgi:hypothetical protein